MEHFSFSSFFLSLCGTLTKSLNFAFAPLIFPIFSTQVFQLAAHLVYWGKAIIIYPLCENNVYMLSPNASVCL